MVLNVLDPAQTRYIVRGEELEEFLKERYRKEHPDFNFSVEVSARYSKLRSLLNVSSMFAIDGYLKRQKS